MKVMRFFSLDLYHEPKLMVKKLLLVFLIFILGLAGWYWTAFIKYHADNKMLNICLLNNRLEIQTEQSAEYISVDTTTSHDTLGIKVYTTSTLNPFADKNWTKVIMIDAKIKYVDFDNKVVPISIFQKRQLY